MKKLTIKTDKMVDTSILGAACEISHRNTEYKRRISAIREELAILAREVAEDIRRTNSAAGYDPIILREVQNMTAILGALEAAKGAVNGAYMA